VPGSIGNTQQINMNLFGTHAAVPNNKQLNFKAPDSVYNKPH
jgi:hypothetical protein